MAYLRRNVWELGGDWADPILWYARGVKAMKARALNEPTAWRFYGAMHGIDQGLWRPLGYLGPGDQMPSSGDSKIFWQQCQHGSWYFLPWHRGYLMAFESIIRDAVTQLDPSVDWALPYWNYFKPGQDKLPPAFAVDGAPAKGIGELVADPSRHGSVSARATFDVDVVLPLLHGPYGEDGTVQGLFELADLPYVGSGVLGSAVAMDKIMMKRAFAAAQLPTPSHRAFRDGHDLDAFMDDVERELGLPCFVKPVNMGSSVGVSKARSRAELREAILHASTFDEWVLAEEMVRGREIEVGILGDDPPVASRPGEVVPAADFYDYADKYEDGKA